MLKRKVSFDFDGTLNCGYVQAFVKSLIKKYPDIEVWITTTRSNNIPGHSTYNDDLFRVAKYLGIKTEHIIFTNNVLKYNVLKDKDFIFHLDDNTKELEEIKMKTSVIPIGLKDSGLDNEFGGPTYWRYMCQYLIDNNFEKCQSCENSFGVELHICPYAEEIENSNILCNCCVSCVKDCENEI
jgi:hypothetical protein